MRGGLLRLGEAPALSPRLVREWALCSIWRYCNLKQNVHIYARSQEGRRSVPLEFNPPDCLFMGWSLHLLYCDISGNVGSTSQTHIVLGGVAVKEDAIYHVIKELDDIVAQYPNYFPPETELHANEIAAGRKRWRRVPQEVRSEIFERVLGVFSGPSATNLTAFGVVVEKRRIEDGQDPIFVAYEQIVTRFNKYLSRAYQANRRRFKSHVTKHRGLVVFDDSRYEQDLQGLAAQYRVNGTKYGKLPFLAEVPLFSNSEASRLIQLADMVSYALWRKFEKSDGKLLALFASSFDRAKGRTHGLYHFTSDTGCDCPSCLET